MSAQPCWLLTVQQGRSLLTDPRRCKPWRPPHPAARIQHTSAVMPRSTRQLTLPQGPSVPGTPHGIVWCGAVPQHCSDRSAASEQPPPAAPTGIIRGVSHASRRTPIQAGSQRHVTADMRSAPGGRRDILCQHAARCCDSGNITIASNGTNTLCIAERRSLQAAQMSAACHHWRRCSGVKSVLPPRTHHVSSTVSCRRANPSAELQAGCQQRAKCFAPASSSNMNAPQDTLDRLHVVPSAEVLQ